VTSDVRLGAGLAAGGVVGLLAAHVLLLERFKLAENPSYTPSSRVHPVLSCGSVMESWQASLLGFPNPVLGVVAFPVVVSTGVALVSGAQLAQWYWRGLQIGVLVGLIFVAWLAFQSLYRIGALCPYCMAVWAVVWPIAWFVTTRNLRAGVLGRGASGSRGLRTVLEWQGFIVLVPYVAVLAAVIVRFWSFWVG
jgi:uncharacterized membrane protein